MSESAKRTNRSPWFYIGVGCLGLIVCAVIVMGTCTVVGYRWAKKLETELKDPVSREHRAAEILGVAQLPPGYYAAIPLQIPFQLMDTVMLTDRPPGPDAPNVDPSPVADHRSLLYFHTSLKKSNDPRILDYFEGRTDDPSVLREAGLKLDLPAGKIFDRGVFEGSPRLLFVIVQGRGVLVNNRDSQAMAIALVHCDQDPSLRVFIVSGTEPMPAPADGTAQAIEPQSLTDRTGVERFLRQFSVCTAKPAGSN
jgi:hypothetical protein